MSNNPNTKKIEDWVKQEREREREATDEGTSCDVYGAVWKRNPPIYGGNDLASTITSAVVATAMTLGEKRQTPMDRLTNSYENYMKHVRNIVNTTVFNL